MFADKFIVLYYKGIPIKLEKFIEYPNSTLYRVKDQVYIGQVLITPDAHSFTFDMMDENEKRHIFNSATWNTTAIAIEMASFFEISCDEE